MVLTAKIVGRILRRMIERKIEDIFVEDQFGFRNGKGTRDEIWMPSIISERTLDIDEELCVCFINWQKAFDSVNWTKLLQILKETGINRCEKIFIIIMKMDQSVKVRVDQGVTRSVKMEDELDKAAICRQFSSTYTASILPREILKGLQISKQEDKYFAM
jgi:hypothetical protein